MRGARGCLAALAAALLLGACAGSPTAPQAGSPGKALALYNCGIANVMEPVLCGDLKVPENWLYPGGTQISLNVVVVPSTDPRTLPPLYDLAGGPGLPATAAAGFWTGPGAIHRAHRDIVLIDQRGTGGSHPLPCKLYTDNPFRPVLDDQDAGDCRDKLWQEADLSQYSTAAAVADIEAVRVALGHERIDLTGLSYGTRLAQEYQHSFPLRVRAMALLGTVSPSDKLPLAFAKNADAVLAKLVKQCAADKACHKAVPNLAADLTKLQKLFEPGSIKLKLPDGSVRELLAGPFWEAIRAQLVSARTQRQLPWLLHQAAAKDFMPLLKQIEPRPDRASMGALLSVSCPEDTQRITDAEIAAAGAGVFGNYRLRQQAHTCRIWGLPPRPAAHPVAEGPVPVLLMAGDMDAVTPPAEAQEVAANLPNARVIVVPGLGHFPDGLTNPECYDGIIAEFFETGSAAKLDTTCLAAMQPLPFQTQAAGARP